MNKSISSLILILVVVVGLAGWWLLQNNSVADPDLDQPRLVPAPQALQPDPHKNGRDKAVPKDTGEKPSVALIFDDGSTPRSEETMRFGIIVPGIEDDDTATGFKQLTSHPEGIHNNTCLKIDDQQYLFGHPPGQWVEMAAKLGQDAEGQPRFGRKSVWKLPGEKIQVTQTVEIVRGTLTGKLDTVQVHYRIDNQDDQSRRVGLRFLLDTFIGGNDGAPFVVPGRDWLCEKQMQFPKPEAVPPFVFALEEMKLNKPGVVAQIGLKFPDPAEAPVRLTLGGWPDERTTIKGAKSGLTLWEVPVFPLDKIDDGAAALYWDVKEMKSGETREMGFTYGLGVFTANEAGTLGFFVAGTPRVGTELVLTALFKEPDVGQQVVLKAVPGFEILEDDSEQTISFPPVGEYPFSPVAWKLRSTQAGKLPLRIGTGKVWHEYAVEIAEK